MVEALLQNTKCSEKSSVREERRLVSVAAFASARKELYLGKNPLRITPRIWAENVRCELYANGFIMGSRWKMFLLT